MNINQAKDYFQLGLINEAAIYSSDESGSIVWRLQLSGDRSFCENLCTMRGSIRFFKTLDSCASTAVDIGFKSFTVFID